MIDCQIKVLNEHESGYTNVPLWITDLDRVPAVGEHLVWHDADPELGPSRVGADLEGLTLEVVRVMWRTEALQYAGDDVLGERRAEVTAVLGVNVLELAQEKRS